LAHRVPAGLTPAEGRKFGLTLAIAFGVLAGISAWRGHGIAPYVLGSLAAAFGLAGLLIPGRLGPVFRGWMRFGLLLSKVTTPILLGVVYFLVITPIGFLLRLLGKNPLRHRLGGEGEGSYWVRRSPDGSGGAERMRRQF
jgi:hypothetical protein